MKNGIYAVYSVKETDLLTKQAAGLCHIRIVRSSEEVIEALNTKSFDFVLLDIEIGGLFPTEIIKKINRLFPCIPIFLISWSKKNSFAKHILNYRIAGFFNFPADLPLIFSRIENFFVKRTAFLSGRCKKNAYPILNEILEMQLIGKSNACRRLRYFIHLAADSLLPVLLLGETGCGKDLAAKLIHEISDVKDGAFVQVNVNCIPSSLAESILFGTETGSFTGAEHKDGVLLEAHGGTLFLNEMESLDLPLQSKLLDVIETKQIRPIGSAKVKQSDFRLICASNKNLKKLVKQGKFRKDLYFRLDVLHFKIPPLRKRKEDIRPLTEFYLKKLQKSISDTALHKLHLYDWPGNIRELFNCLERAACFSKGEKIIKEYHIEF